MVRAEDPVDVRQLVIVAAVAVAAAAIAVRFRLAPTKTNVRWHSAAALVAINTLYGFVRGRGTWVGFAVQPVIVLLAVWGLRPNEFIDRLAAFLYVAVAVVGTLLEPMADIAGLVYLLYLAITVVQGPMGDTWKQRAYVAGVAYCAAEAAIVAVLFATADTDEVTLRAEHYTWWSITVFALWDLLLFTEAYIYYEQTHPLTALTDHFAGVVSVVAAVVGLGVLYMSANECELLSDALDEAGDSLYVVGNFAMHYYPLIRLFAYQPQFYVLDLLRGVGLGLVYSLTYPATDVYGCSEPLPAYTPAIMTGVGMVSAAGLWAASGVRLTESETRKL